VKPAGNDLVHSFTVRPFPRRKTEVRVLVYPSRARMLAAARRRGIEIGNPVAFVTGKGRRKPRACDLCICLGWLDLATLSHESVHAAMRWIDAYYGESWLVQNENFDVEEVAAEVQGRILTQVVFGLKKYGLLDRELAYTKRRTRHWSELRIVEAA